LAAGAFAIVVGSAVTRPRDITGRFAAAVRAWSATEDSQIPAIDLGGTHIKSGLVSSQGQLSVESVVPTRVSGGRTGLIEQLTEIGRRLIGGPHSIAALGFATAGWVDAASGRVVYATANLPDWTGVPIAEILARELGVRVFVDNDANALAVGEKRFGEARMAQDFACITLGTGVGAGCFVGG
jgi:glucokinase